MSSGSIYKKKTLPINNSFTNQSVNKKDLALNNPQGLLSRNTK